MCLFCLLARYRPAFLGASDWYPHKILRGHFQNHEPRPQWGLSLLEMMHKIPWPVTAKKKTVTPIMEGSYKLNSYKILNRSNGSVKNDPQWVSNWKKKGGLEEMMMWTRKAVHERPPSKMICCSQNALKIIF